MIVVLILIGSIPLVAIASLVASKVKNAREEARGWRLRFVSGGCRYEEKNECAAWIGIEIEGIFCGHVVRDLRFKSPTSWEKYPAWAAQRRTEIVTRVRKEYRVGRCYDWDELYQPPKSGRPDPYEFKII